MSRHQKTSQPTRGREERIGHSDSSKGKGCGQRRPFMDNAGTYRIQEERKKPIRNRNKSNRTRQERKSNKR